MRRGSGIPVGRRPGLLLGEVGEMLLGRSCALCLALCLEQPCPLLAGLGRSDVLRDCGLRGSKTRNAARRKETTAPPPPPRPAAPTNNARGTSQGCNHPNSLLQSQA